MLRLITHALARLLPRDLRDAHGDEIARDIDRRFAAGQRLSTVRDVAAAAVRERRADRLTPPFPQRRSPLMTNVLQDLRFATRMLKRQPGFALAVVITLGLGIGSATAVISLADATVLRPVPAKQPDRLVGIPWSLSFPDFLDLQKRDTGLEGLAAYSNLAGISLDARGATRRVPATLVSGNYFDVLGLAPAAGRLLTPADDTAGSVPNVVISHRLWHAVFGGSADAVGQAIRLNGRPATLIGVAPENFKGLALGNVGDVWMPAVQAPVLATGFIGRPAALTRDMFWLRTVGRLRADVDLPQATGRLEAILKEMHPEAGENREPLALEPITSLVVTSRSRDALGQFILLLSAIAAVLMLLACANVANLLLARAASRRQEMGVRVALGAGRARLMSQLLIESAMLGAAGMAAGVAVAAAGMKALSQYRLPGDVLIADLGLRVNVWVLAWSIALAGMAVLLFGLVPAWVTSRRDITTVLRQGGRTATRTPLGRSLVTVQIALSVVMVGAGLLFARGLQRAMSFDLGYVPAGAVMTSADPSLERLPAKRLEEYVINALDRLRSDRTIEAAGAAVTRPMRGNMTSSFKPLGYKPADPDDLYVSFNLISDGWIEAVGLPVVSGRAFTQQDRGANPQVALVSQTLARKVWPAGDAVGQRITLDAEDPKSPVIEIAGIVADARYGAVDAKPASVIYLSLFAEGMSAFRGQMHFVARARGDSSAAIATLRGALQAAEPRVPLFDSMTLEDHVAGALMPQRLGLVLLAIFSMSALVLAAAGVYAIAAYAVSARTREIGIRMALGAGRARVLRQVVRDVAMPVAAGIAAGLAIQLGASKLAESFVFGLTAKAPLQLLAASAVVLAAAALALAFPARRAASIDPAIALRE